MNLGQYFTPPDIADKMINLIQNHGSILEPSCGNGIFLSKLPIAIGVEIDPQYKGERVIVGDFFAQKLNTFDTIIGNPPYVRYQEIIKTTKELLPNILDHRSNLYLFFMWRCIDLLNPNGELIFIVPRDFLKTTSARPLNKRFMQEGVFTYFEEFGDQVIFANASPNVCIFRWVKNPNAHTDLIITETDGFLSFSSSTNHINLITDLFEVKTGGVSGCNEIYYQPFGNIDLVISTTKRTGILQKAILETKPTEYLLQFKDKLLNRKVRHFTEENWYEWGRKLSLMPERHIYVNTKTRDPEPFFYNACCYHDGSLLGLACKDTNKYDLDYLIYCLNHNNWEEQGFKVGGRLIFGQRNLSAAHLILR